MKKRLILGVFIFLVCLFLASCSFNLSDYINTGNNTNNTNNNSNNNNNNNNNQDPNNQEPNNQNIELEDGEQILTIIEANDVHGYIMQDEDGRNGISNMAYLINNIREDVGENNVLLIANGDMFQGTGLVRMSFGQVMIDVMGEMGFDATCLGNHEFDWDLPVILKYFDGNIDNGEAKFPLVNSNVYQDGKLVIDQNICETAIFEKAGVKVGLIGYIGDVKSSINALFADKYEFKTNFENLTKRLALSLKDSGADIIVVSIHDGDTSGVSSFDVNKTLANLKDGDNYLIDAVINGHTHTYQDGAISRSGGVAMPVVQSNGYRSSYLYSFGRIDLTIKDKKVTGYSTSHLHASDAKDNYDEKVEDVLDAYFERDKETLTKTIVNSTSTISRYSDKTYDWVSGVMLASTGADIAICNTGGLRSNIVSGKLTFEDLYQFNPFDNYIIIHELSSNLIRQFLTENEGYYFYSTKTGQIESNKTYKVAIIDYVYYSRYYNYYRNKGANAVTTDLIVRDILIEDLSLRQSFNVFLDYAPVIGNKIGNKYSGYHIIYIEEERWYLYL